MKNFSLSKNIKIVLIPGLIIVLALIFNFLATESKAVSSLEQGMVAYWNFDQLGTWLISDRSGNNNNGYLNQALLGMAGKKDYGVFFDGNGDYINLGDLPGLDFGPNDSFALAAWIKMDQSIGDWHVILGKASNYSLDGYALRHSRNGNLNMMIEASDGAKESGATAQGDYRDNNWHLVVGVIDRENKTNTIYVDGIEKGQSDISQIGDLSNDYYFNIGALNRGALSFKGLIDEVRIYQRALSSIEIRQLYNQDCRCAGLPLVKIYPAGSLLQNKNSYQVYYLNKKGQKKWIVNERIFNLYNNQWSDVIKVNSEELSVYPTVKLMRAEQNEKIYLISGTKKKWIKTPQEFINQGYLWSEVDLVKPEELKEYQEVEDF